MDPDHPSIATAEYDLANVARDEGKFAEAELRYRRALAIRQRVFGPMGPALGEVLVDFAKLLRTTRHAAEAERLEARARAIGETAKVAAP